MKKTFTYFLGGALFALFLLMPSTASAKVTINWDWKNSIPSTIRNAVPEGTNASGSIASDVEGVTLDYYAKVEGAYAKLQYVSGQDYAQFNENTAFRIPVVSTSDKITIKTKSGQHDYTFDGVAATEDDHTYDITADQVTAGYVEIVSTAYMNIYSVKAVLAHKPIEVVAKWTFDTGYSIDGRICTPNSETWKAIPASVTQAKNNTAYQFNANTRYKTSTNCLAYIGNDNTGKTYYQVKDNNGDKVLNLYPNGTVNAIEGDYTNEAKHLLYYEFTFPTTGLKDVNMSVEFTYYNSDGKKMEMVYSTDDGSTWTDAGFIAGGANWYTYNTTTTALSADNKANVIVRLLPEDGSSLQVYINSVTITGKRATTSVTVSDAKYATYFNSIPVELPENLQAATIDAETSGTLTLNYRYGEGDVIPGGTPVLLKASAADTYTLIYAADNTESAPSGNLLHGSDVATTTTGSGKHYALMTGSKGLGFYWHAAEGAPFSIAAHKAWLVLSDTPANFFSLDDETTGISEIEKMRNAENEAFFNLAGQRVAQPSKGLYIVNGRKVIIK